MVALGFTPTEETSTATLRLFFGLALAIEELLTVKTVPVEAKARAIASMAAEVASPDFTDIDLGIVSQPHQASEKLRRMDIGNALFVRLRRFLGRLADEGLLTDLSG